MNEKTFGDFIYRHRVFPRLFAIFYLFMTWEVWQWTKFNNLTEHQHYFAMAVIAGAVGYFKFYVDTGNRE